MTSEQRGGGGKRQGLHARLDPAGSSVSQELIIPTSQIRREERRGPWPAPGSPAPWPLLPKRYPMPAQSTRALCHICDTPPASHGPHVPVQSHSTGSPRVWALEAAVAKAQAAERSSGSSLLLAVCVSLGPGQPTALPTATAPLPLSSLILLSRDTFGGA